MLRKTLIAALLVVCQATALAVAQPRVVRIAVITDGPWARNTEVLDLFKQEILDVTAGEFDIRFPEGEPFQADWTLEGVGHGVSAVLSDRDIDMVIGLGVLSSNELCRRGNLPKPALAPFVLDAYVQGLPEKDGTSGVKNLNYLIFPNNVVNDVRAFLDIVPFTKMAVLFNKSIHDAIPELRHRRPLALEELGVKTEAIPIDVPVDESLARLSDDVEAAYVTPLHHLPEEELDRLIEILNGRKLPTFSMFGRADVERGMLASLNREIFPRLARRVALNVQRILLGEEPGDLPIAFAPRHQLTINLATARRIGVYPDWGVLTEADVLFEGREEIDRIITIGQAVDEALAANRDIAAAEKIVAAGAQEVKSTRSTLLPQVDISALGLVVDKDRAETSFGQQPEKTASGSARLSQLIYSDRAYANYSIDKNIQITREKERDITRLDITQAAATAYLDVLRAKTFERIQKENLKLTRSNLDLAQVRETLGTARAAEVLRWESQLADNRKAVIEANALRNVAEIELNRFLNRPLEEHFGTVEADINDPRLLLSQGRFLEYMGDKWSFKMLRAFLVDEGIKASPELQRLRAAIAAQERVVKSTTRAFWLPDLALQGEVTNIFLREGAGTEPPVGFPEPKDLTWDVGVTLTFPLFTGGGKFYERSGALEELAGLRREYESAAQRIEQRIRSSLHLAGARYAGIKQSRLAADAAGRTLDLVIDSYSLGAASIVDLLDAQNNALVSEEVEATAMYDFLVDFMEVERALGMLVLQMSEEERTTLFDRMDAYFEIRRTERE